MTTSNKIYKNDAFAAISDNLRILQTRSDFIKVIEWVIDEMDNKGMKVEFQTVEKIINLLEDRKLRPWREVAADVLCREYSKYLTKVRG